MEYNIDLIWINISIRNDLRFALRNALAKIGVLPCWQEYSSKDKSNQYHIKSDVILVNGHIVYSSSDFVTISVDELAQRIITFHNFSRFRKSLNLKAPFLTSLIVFLLPKCPFCLAAYLGAFGIAGLEVIPYYSWVRHLSVFVLILTTALFFFWARKVKKYLPVYIMISGSALLVIGKEVLDSTFLISTGVTTIILASFYNSLSMTKRKLFK